MKFNFLEITREMSRYIAYSRTVAVPYRIRRWISIYDINRMVLPETC